MASASVVKPLLIMLPGTDGAGRFFEALTEALLPNVDVKVVAYPQSGDQSYAGLGALLINDLPIDRDYILLGESFGGPLAIWLTAHAPNPPKKLIMGASFAASPFGLLGRIVSPLVAIGQILPLWTWQIRLMLFNGAYAEIAHMIHETVKPIPRTTLLARVKAVLACDMRPLLPLITQPVLYIHANKDRLLPTFLPRHLSGFNSLQIAPRSSTYDFSVCAGNHCRDGFAALYPRNLMSPFSLPEIVTYNRIMAQSFRRFTGQSIIDGDDEGLSDQALAEAMFNAPQGIVSHGTEVDPVFRYANRNALQLWEMDWEAFTRLPSRLSAEPVADIQSDREALLKAALRKGWVDNYQGIRVSSTGKRFYIDQTVLWNVVDNDGVRHGQAAFIRQWRHIAP